MPQTSEWKEEWEVTVDREKFSLNEKQIKVLKEATNSGMRGVVWFDKFSISIPHIKSTKRIRRWRDVKQIENGDAYPDALTGSALVKKMKEMRSKLAKLKDVS